LLSIIIGVCIGIVPAVRSSGVDLLANLRASSNALTARGGRLRTALAATQLALALVLGVGASLLFRSFVHLRRQDLGFRPAKLVAFSVPLKTDAPWEAWDRLLDAMRSIPGAAAWTIGSNLPFQTPTWMPRVMRADQGDEIPSSGMPGYAVTPTFFRTLGIPIIQGRAFDGSDQPLSRPVAIVNQSFARVVFGARDPIGTRIRILADSGLGREVDVVGVAGDAVQGRVEDGIGPAVYVPYTQFGGGEANVVIRSDRDPGDLSMAIRRAVAQAGFQFPVSEISTMSERIDRSHATARFQTFLISAFAGAALLLSAVGLYGTLVFSVRSRTKELGVRMAMGADRRIIYRLVIGQGFAVLGAGLVVGLFGALAVARLLERLLYRVKPMDPLAFGIAVAVLAAAVLLAALRPAWLAARVDPLASIRVEA